jgi:hypothetical protein
LLGSYEAGAGAVFSGRSSSNSPIGRQLVSSAITAGTITTTGTASWWAAVGTASLYAHGLLSVAQAVVAGNSFILGAFNIALANQ